MNYSEMLHDFLDSSLNGSQEETLFRALASDDELRFEMKYLLKLRDAVRDDDEAAVVPIASTNAIFSQLGYTAPAALVGAAGGVVGTQTGLWPLLKSAGGYLLAMLVGAVVTGGVFLLGDDSGDGQLATATKPTATQTQTRPGASTQTGLSGSATGPQANNGATSSATSAMAARIQRPSPAGGTQRVAAAQQRTVEQQDNSANLSAERNRQSIPLGDDAANSAPRNNTPLPENDLVASSTSSDARANALAQGTPQEAPLADPISVLDRGPEPTTEHRSSDLGSPTPLEFEKEKVWRKPTFSLGVRAAVLPFELKSANTALPERSQAIDNISASLSYPLPLHRNLAFMVEAGKESYLLTFNERRSDGRIFQHEVMPSVFWAGVGARYSFAPEARFNPFVQLVGGGSEAGMIGRTMLGLQWSLTDQIGMIGGLEYNIAAYRFQGETTTSPKLGLNYGITFNLFGN